MAEHNHNVVALYIHDYNRRPDDVLYHRIKHHFPNHWTLIAIEYNEDSYDTAIADITKAYEELNADVIIGHGTGGFLTLCMPVKNRVVFNPVLDITYDHERIAMPPEVAETYNAHKYMPGEVTTEELRQSTYAVLGTYDEVTKAKYTYPMSKISTALTHYIGWHIPELLQCNLVDLIRNKMGYNYSDDYPATFVRKFDNTPEEANVVRI